MTKRIAVIGGGPSGLMAADILSAKGHHVTLYDRKPTFGRKFLMAGRGGLNITHSEDFNKFIDKYDGAKEFLRPIINNFSPTDLQNWCHTLGEKTFIGSSGRVFPESFKASPLLRAWLARLEQQNVTFKPKHDWLGWDNNELIFKTAEDKVNISTDITLLALGGASWPGLGSDGSWVKILTEQGVQISRLRPSNCGFVVQWSDIFSNRYQGHSLKSISLSFQDKIINGEFMITRNGIEGGAVYALSSFLREEIMKNSTAELTLDLKPHLDVSEIKKRLLKPRSKLSMSNYLRKTLNLSDVAIGLIMERPDRTELSHYSPEKISKIIKSYPLILTNTFSIDRAISTAGGVSFNAIDQNFMLHNMPNTYVTGEMLDWEAPTGGYLLQACMASGVHVANAIQAKT